MTTTHMSDPRVRVLLQEIQELDAYIQSKFPTLADHIEDLENSIPAGFPPETISKLMWASGMRTGLQRAIYLLTHAKSTDKATTETDPTATATATDNAETP